MFDPMTTSERPTIARFDGLMPPEMARRGEDIGVQKASLDTLSTLSLAVLAGAFIALGGVFATTALAGTAHAPWGPARVLAGMAFSLGLILVTVGGGELFTGNNLIVMAWASGRVTIGALARNWSLVYAGNVLGAAATAGLVFAAGTHRAGGGAFGAAALGVAQAKLQLGWGQAVALGVLCNALVCLAVWLTYSARTTTDRVLAVVFPISAFVAAGFEHSIANMYFIPLALLIGVWDPAFVSATGADPHVLALGWAGFVWRNLLPVSIGNVIGGSLLVGAVYWFVYLRRGPRATSEAATSNATPTADASWSSASTRRGGGIHDRT
jgi:formate transporter